jgi:hypothetical protein
MNGPTDDEVLDKIAAWCAENGWDALDTEAFLAWLPTAGIDRNKLMIGKCKLPDWI